MSDTFKELKCPDCQSAIARRDIINADALIFGVNEDGSIEWNGSSDIDWDSQRPASNPATYQCRGCGRFFKGEDLGIKIPG